MKSIYKHLFGGTTGLVQLGILAALLMVVLPLSLDIFRLNLVGKYLTYAFVALGLVLLWGKAGVLSLGQGVFFGLGGYCMAMFLKLEASDPISTKIQSTPGIPDFMDWNQITQLPAFWIPFKSLPFTLLAVVVVPSIVAFVLGVAMFKRRVGGVYCAIMGRNGMGKTTLLKSLIGILPSRQGSIRLGDKEIAGLASHERVRSGIAFVPQGRMIFPALTVSENILTGARGPVEKSAWDELYALFPILHEMRKRKGGTFPAGSSSSLPSPEPSSPTPRCWCWTSRRKAFSPPSSRTSLAHCDKSVPLVRLPSSSLSRW